MHLSVIDAIGLVGVCSLIYAYARVQWQRDYVRQLSFSALNLMGSLLMTVSLASRWNLPLFVYLVVWALISLYGVYRCLNYARRARMVAAVFPPQD